MPRGPAPSWILEKRAQEDARRQATIATLRAAGATVAPCPRGRYHLVVNGECSTCALVARAEKLRVTPPNDEEVPF